MINNTEEELFCTQYELKTLSDLLIRGEAERWVKGFLQNKYEQEHLERYNFALQYVNNKRVLDIACGSGFGSYLLAYKGNADEVVGVDLDQNAIRYGNYRHHHPKVTRIHGDACKYKNSNQFETIISFETIEHVPDYQSFLHNLNDNLASNGVLIISTPIRKQTIIKPSHNPFHEIEWSYYDFIKLLETNFILENSYIQDGIVLGQYPTYSFKNRLFRKLGVKKFVKSKSVLHQGITEAKNLNISTIDSGYTILILRKK